MNWCKLLEVITYRHRLIQNAFVSDIPLNSYEKTATEMGIDVCHAYMRPVYFDLAKKKSDSEKKPATIRQLIEDESRVDR